MVIENPVYNFIYTHVGKPGVGFHENQPFSDIFFDKFKNLLDDYIVNYQVKYFFYTLFISFFYLELSEGMFQLLHNYSPYHLSLFGSFIIDFCYSLFNIGIIDFFYSYFAFNLNSIGLFISLVSYKKIWYSTVVMVAFLCSVLRVYENYKDELNLRLVAFAYFLYSFFFFLLFYLNIGSVGSYIHVTFFILVIHKMNLSHKWDSIDGFAVLAISSLIFLPYYIIFLFFVIMIYWSLIPMLSGERNMVDIKDTSLEFVGSFLILVVLSFFIYRLDYVGSSTFLFILTSLPFIIYVTYICYKDEVEDENELNKIS